MTARTLRSFSMSRWHRLRGNADDGVAMLMALFVMLMVSTLSVGILAITLNEAKPTILQHKLTQTINAAQGGLQVALNQLRAANDGKGDNVGVLGELPCTTNSANFVVSGAAAQADGASFSGSVGNASGAATYDVDIAYYGSDPTNFSAADLASKDMHCVSGHPTAIPAYAFIQSAGRGSGVPGLAATNGNRSVHGTYEFSRDNVNFAGGRVLEYGTTLCMEAANNPRVGSTVSMQPCQPLGYAPQLWSYRTDLTLLYEGNEALNLCIQAQAAAGSPVTLQTCTSAASTAQPTTYGYLTGQQVQEWPFNDSGHFATAATGGSVGSTCLQPSGADDDTSAVAGALLVIAACGGDTQGYTAWNPDPQVGAGKAGTVTSGIPGAPTNQLVNYQEFGRCLDINGQNVNNNNLIAYPCKQAPDSKQLTYNQVWTFSGKAGGTGTMSAVCANESATNCTNGVQYCLTTPASGVVVIAAQCNGSPTQTWQATGDIVGNYYSSYEFVSSGGQCLTSDPTPYSINTSGYSTIVIAACDGTAKQKWNAPANPLNTNLSNLQEDQGNK